MEVTYWLLSQVIDYVIFFCGFILVLWRHAHPLFFVAASSARVAASLEHLELVVNKLGRTDLNWMLRLKFVRCWIVRRKPES